MRIFLAGATGVIGRRLLPRMIEAGHTVAAMTRTPGKIAELRAAGALPLLCDVYDTAALNAAVAGFAPDLVMHQLTDLPDDFARIAEHRPANDRMRTVGTKNLLDAARLARVPRFVAQSIAWRSGPVLATHEAAVLAAGGVVLRYGQFYGRGTFFERELPPPPRIAIDEAARRTLALLTMPSGVVTIVDDDGDSNSQ